MLSLSPYFSILTSRLGSGRWRLVPTRPGSTGRRSQHSSVISCTRLRIYNYDDICHVSIFEKLTSNTKLTSVLYSGLVIDQARKDEFRVWNIDDIAKKRTEAADGKVLAQERDDHKDTALEKTRKSSQDKSGSV